MSSPGFTLCRAIASETGSCLTQKEKQTASLSKKNAKTVTKNSQGKVFIFQYMC
jgi:hypothetical protein